MKKIRQVKEQGERERRNWAGERKTIG